MGANKYWKHQDIILHYFQEGKGAPFFLIHGYAQALDWRVWEKTIPLLASNHTVFAFDMVGHGKSTHVEPKPTAHQQADLLIKLIHEKNLKNCSLGGVSWGGTICQLVASKIPSRIKRLLLVSSAGYHLPDSVLASTQDIPTLILWSEDDAVIPIEKGKNLATKLPNAQFIVIPVVPGVSSKAAHHPQRNKANLTNPHILSFIQATE